MDIVHSYTATVRGYHYYKQFWNPVKNEELRCSHEEFNLYDIKVIHQNGKTVGHLPRELSRVTKLFLDRGVTMYVNLSAGHYILSPLVQAGMEIPCTVNFRMPSTIKNAQLAERYLKSSDLSSLRRCLNPQPH